MAAAGVGWLTIGVIVYIIYRRRQGLDLTTTTKVAIPRSAIEKEAEYDSVLVAFDERGLVGVLDWEFARLDDPARDLALQLGGVALQLGDVLAILGDGAAQALHLMADLLARQARDLLLEDGG